MRKTWDRSHGLAATLFVTLIVAFLVACCWTCIGMWRQRHVVGFCEEQSVTTFSGAGQTLYAEGQRSQFELRCTRTVLQRWRRWLLLLWYLFVLLVGRSGLLGCRRRRSHRDQALLRQMLLNRFQRSRCGKNKTTTVRTFRCTFVWTLCGTRGFGVWKRMGRWASFAFRCGWRKRSDHGGVKMFGTTVRHTRWCACLRTG